MIACPHEHRCRCRNSFEFFLDDLARNENAALAPPRVPSNAAALVLPARCLTFAVDRRITVYHDRRRRGPPSRVWRRTAKAADASSERSAVRLGTMRDYGGPDVSAGVQMPAFQRGRADFRVEFLAAQPMREAPARRGQDSCGHKGSPATEGALRRSDDWCRLSLPGSVSWD